MRPRARGFSTPLRSGRNDGGGVGQVRPSIRPFGPTQDEGQVVWDQQISLQPRPTPSFRPEPCGARRSGETLRPRARGFSTPLRSGRNDGGWVGQVRPSIRPFGPTQDEASIRGSAATQDEGGRWAAQDLPLIPSRPEGPYRGTRDGNGSIRNGQAPAPPPTPSFRPEPCGARRSGETLRPRARGFSTPLRSGRNDGGGGGQWAAQDLPLIPSRPEGPYRDAMGWAAELWHSVALWI